MIQPSSETSDAPARYDAASRLEEFRTLRARGALDGATTERLATEAASAFFNRFEKSGEYLADAVTLLAEISALDDPSLAEPGRRATFPLLIERLSDSFDPRLCPLYDRAFAQMISICRRLPSGEKLDAALQHFGLTGEPEIIARKARLRSRPPMLNAAAQARVKKAIVLSRVTLGADIAVTSIVLQKARRIFPQAELVIAGSQKLAQLFGGDMRLRLRPLHYQSEGGLLDRLSSWQPLIEAIEDETRGLSPGEWVLIDPDSRLLQLGLLPAIANDDGYFFLESRAFGKTGDGNLSQITLRWLDERFGRAAQSESDILPTVYLKNDDIAWGRSVSLSLRRCGAHFLVATSFGVGGNQDKRLPDPFEERLLSRLIDEGCTPILDSGFGADEVQRSKLLAERLISQGRSVVELGAKNAQGFSSGEIIRCHMLTWHGEIGPFAALIGASDEYIGYDSSGQHIAAALGVPAIDIFAGNTTPIFRERWTPSGRAPVQVIAPSDPDSALEEVIGRHKSIQAAAVQSESPEKN